MQFALIGKRIYMLMQIDFSMIGMESFRLQ